MLGWPGRQSATTTTTTTPAAGGGADDDDAVNANANANNTMNTMNSPGNSTTSPGNNNSSNTTTKLSAKAANSLREKRRAGNNNNNNTNNSSGGGGNGTPSSRPSSPKTITDGDGQAAASSTSSAITGEEFESEAESNNNSNQQQQQQQQQRSKVFSFFDPEEIRRPPTSPMNRPPPSPSMPASPSGNHHHLSSNYYSMENAIVTNVGGGGGDDASVATSRIRNHNRYGTTNNNNNNNKNPIQPPQLAVATDRTSTFNPTTTTTTTTTHNNTNNSNNNNNSATMTPTSSARAYLASVIDAHCCPMEVKYEDGATELFMLVEDANWEEVCTRIEYNPSEAKVWVISSGTENTVFSWSVWRRLPLHEACRRQPPPVVIYALLAAYPDSAMEENNFSELPLHAAVRCGACAEVVNCILASYPAGALARDNSGCTPLDILNGIGKMMDHDAVVAALTRAINVHTRETKMWEEKIAAMQLEFGKLNDKRKWEYERSIAEKTNVIENLERTSEQERLATSNLAVKVIQTEQIVSDKQKTEKRYVEKIRKYEEEIAALKSSNGLRKSRIHELEDTVRSDSTTILELNNRIKSLQSSLVALVQEEEEFAATKLATAGMNFKLLVESQFVFLREAEGRKESIRARVKQLGVNIPPKKKSDAEVAEEDKEAMKKKELAEMPVVEEVSNDEVAEKALASAIAQLAPYVDGDDEEG